MPELLTVFQLLGDPAMRLGSRQARGETASARFHVTRRVSAVGAGGA